MINRSDFSSMQYPWKLAQQRKRMVKWMTLPMMLSTDMLVAWTNAMYPSTSESKGDK